VDRRFWANRVDSAVWGLAIGDALPGAWVIVAALALPAGFGDDCGPAYLFRAVLREFEVAVGVIAQKLDTFHA
jgi:uncharacterized protein (DUF39 family)